LSTQWEFRKSNLGTCTSREVWFVPAIGGIWARKSERDEDHNAAGHVLRCGDTGLTTGNTGIHRPAQGKSIHSRV